MGSLCSKSSQTVEEDDGTNTGKVFLKKYGRLDWACEESTNAELAKAGKRYEGHKILMNLHSSHILNCKVIQVTEEGFLVEPYDISGFTDKSPEKFDYKKPIPFSKFYHVFLQK